MMELQITILSADRELISRLAAHDPSNEAQRAGRSGAAISWRTGTPERLPGAIEVSWQLLVDVGIVAAPVSVVCNLIASWIWSARGERPAPTAKAGGEIRLVLENGERVAELRVPVESREDALAAIEAALRHVNPDW